MSQSPRAIKPTDKRIDYLVRAKQARQVKNQRRQMSLGFVTESQAWAADGKIQAPASGNSPARNSITKRIMTSQDEASTRRSIDGQTRNSRTF